MAKFKVKSTEGTHDSLEPMRTHFAKGSAIFAEGDLGLAMYVVESGTVEIRKKLGGKERVLATLSKGDFFGEMCMLEEETPRSAAAYAVEDVTAVMIDQSAFTFILKHNPEIAIRMMRKLAIRLQQTTELLEEAVGHRHQGHRERSQTRSERPLDRDQQRHQLSARRLAGDDCRSDRPSHRYSPRRRSDAGRRQALDLPSPRASSARG
jgi:CRP/FNR family cyclic AMP-dependent transcriptional regulator